MKNQSITPTLITHSNEICGRCGFVRRYEFPHPVTWDTARIIAKFAMCDQCADAVLSSAIAETAKPSPVDPVQKL